MLDVHRGPDLDPGLAELLHIHPTLRVAAAGEIGVGQLVQQQDLRPPGEGAVDVELLHRLAAVGEAAARQDLQLTDLRLRLRPAVGLGQPDDDVGATKAPPPALDQHLEGLADARGSAEENLQAAATLPGGDGEQRLGSGRPGSWALELPGVAMRGAYSVESALSPAFAAAGLPDTGPCRSEGDRHHAADPGRRLERSPGPILLERLVK